MENPVMILGGGGLGAVALDIFKKNEVVVYPNPSTEIISVHSPNNIKSITVFSMDGRGIITYTNPMTSTDFTINVQNLSVGLYTLKVNTDNGTFSKKIIIRR